MGNNSRKNHSADFKAKVALEALKEQMTLPELEKKFGVSQYTISRWKNELLRNASQTFGAANNEEAHQKDEDPTTRRHNISTDFEVQCLMQELLFWVSPCKGSFNACLRHEAMY